MPSEFPRARAAACCGLALLLAACAAPAPPPEPPPVVLPAPEPPKPEPAAAPEPPPEPEPQSASRSAAEHPLEVAITYAERVRALGAAELAHEIERLGGSSYTPLRATQLALALAHTRTAPNASRAQSLLQQVMADPAEEARGLHSLARLLSAQIADQRRADEQAERQAQQLRDAQRRIEQLNEKLEAVRAIERSLPGPDRRP